MKSWDWSKGTIFKPMEGDLRHARLASALPKQEETKAQPAAVNQGRALIQQKKLRIEVLNHELVGGLEHELYFSIYWE